MDSFSLHQEAEMKCLNAAAVCFAVLYAIDAICFDGSYFAVVHHMLSEFYRHWL